MVAVRADGPGRATRVRPMAVGSARSVPRAGGPRRPGLRSLDAVGPHQLGDVPGRGRPRDRPEPVLGFCLTGW